MTDITTQKHPSNRKVIHAAGILIVQPDQELGAYWRETLVDFGMSGVRVVPDADAAVASAKAQAPSGIVVALPNQGDAMALVARLTQGEAGPFGDVPIVLVMARPTRSAVIAAANAGFDAVLPSPLHPRLIYRRMGSLMQRARRSARQRLAVHGALSEALGTAGEPG